ncbi:metal ABC transporter permease [Leucobacter chinensis]|uniref:metal ABC transporter permease n=1 Tax=Leucobacter chinensis TaxID=2851010 RepID=UPI001C234780|nr:metal ABC transporter permease [Leucobacter chinensis]
MQFLIDIFAYEFLQKALVVSIITGVISGVIGSLVMLRGLALMGDAISHAVVPGVAVSYLLGINFFWGAMVAGLCAALGVGFIQNRTRVKQDAAMGIMLSSMFALGIVLIAHAKSAIDLNSILFGNVLAVRTEDMIVSIAVGTIVLVTVLLLYKELVVSSFDPASAEVYGFKTKRLQYLVLVMLTLVTVTSMQTVGVVLVISLLVTPAATALLLVKRLPAMLVIAASLGAVSSFVGIIVSFELNLPSGPVIALVATLFFLVALLFSPSQGIITRNIRTTERKGVAQ